MSRFLHMARACLTCDTYPELHKATKAAAKEIVRKDNKI
jgi:hypothetical protein